MSIEITGAGGALKAVGILTIAAEPGDNTLRALGISELVTVAAGKVRITLEDAIAQTEFLFVSGGAEGVASWLDNTHVEIAVEDVPFFFLIYRISGLGTLTAAAVP